MILSVAAMVSVDKRDIYDVLLPNITKRGFRGISLAELLDDVELHLMETIPKEPGAAMGRFQFCPDIQLRRVKVSVRFPIPGTKKERVWNGRLTVVVTRWPGDGFYIATVPRLGLKTFAVESTALLTEALERFLEAYGKREHIQNFDPFVSWSYEYLEILQVDTELPTVLPSKPPKRKKAKKKRRKKKKSKKDQKKGAHKPPKRRPVPPVTLRKVGFNLSHRARDGRLGRTFGRESVVENVSSQLERDGAAILLVGPHGVGKTAIVHEIVRRMSSEHVSLKDRSDVWSVDGNRIISGMSMVGAWEQRCEAMVSELNARRDVLFVDDLPALVYTGRSMHSDTNVAEFLEPHLARGDLRIIGECTPERLEATREEAPGFFARFHIVQVPELSERDTLMVLVSAMRQIEAAERAVIEPEVLEAVLALTRRFAANRCHPGKAVDLLRQLVADYRKVEADKYGRRIIGRKQLIEVYSQQTGLPSFVLWERQARRHADILAHFKRRIIAQETASLAVSDVVAILQQGLNDPQRPLATFLFVGPTGVGKTETAKALAEYLFGGAARMIRFDMSEFREPWSAARLFGDRRQPEGELTRRVAQQPFSVILFDEIEKADPSIFDALLQVLGEGRMTNAAGRTTDFCNAVIIMTSNLGVRESQRSMGFGGSTGVARDAHFHKAAEKFFRPEFFNRIDRIVAFRSLGRDAIAPLVRRLLQEILGRRGLRRSGVLVQVEPELVELLIDEGFEPRYGARSLKRALEQRLTVPLARHLVAQPVDKTTLINLHRRGTQIGMDLWALDDAPVTPWAPPESAGWSGLIERHAALMAQLDAMAEGAQVSDIEEAQTHLLDRFNEAALKTADWAQLGSVSELIQDVAQLTQALSDFSDTYLEAYDFIESFEIIAPELIRNHQGRNRPIQVLSEHAVALDRELVQGKAEHQLLELERDLAALRYRIAAANSPQRAALVRFMPATDDDTAVLWAARLASAFEHCWGKWGDGRMFIKAKGVWQQGKLNVSNTVSVYIDEEGFELGQEALHGIRAFALEIRGPGLLDLVTAEAGYHLDQYHSGADLICDLVRIEDVGVEDTAPIPRLTALDEAFDTWRTARLSGEDVAHPLPPMPIRRRFEAGQCVDIGTGVELRAEGFGDGLFEVMTRRLLMQS